MPDSSPVVRHCLACGVDVSVPGHFADPRCPTCDGVLIRSYSAGQGERDATLMEVRRDSSPEGAPAARPKGSRAARPVDETFRDPLAEPPSTDSEERRRTGAGASRGAARAEDAHEFAETATFPGGEALQASEHRMGPYRLVRILGKGGMGIVYEAVHTELGRTVALKVMSGRDSGAEELERFRREARAAAKLKHPNIVPILEVGEHQGQHYFTMDLVRGQTLQALARSGTLAPARAAELVAQTARAIHYAHEAGIIHRDLKPSNILVDEGGSPHVMDFGLAKDLGDVSGLTMTGVAMGSPPYMPPEQARGEFRHVDEVSDVYGLGASLYECLAGQAPFGGKSLYDIIAKVLVEEPKPPSQIKPEVPYDLETICLKALEKEKWRRYPDAAEFARDLDRFAQGASIRARRQGLTTRVGRYLVRNRQVIVAVLIPMALVAALSVYAFGRDTPAKVEAPSVEVPSLGPIAQAARELADQDPSQALTTLAGAFPRPVRADQALSALDRLPGARRGALGRARAGVESAGETLSPELLGEVLTALGRQTARDLPLDDLEAALQALFGPDDPLGALARQGVLALRARETNSVVPLRAAWGKALSPLDLSLLQASAARREEDHAARFVAARDELTRPDLPQSALPDHPLELDPRATRIQARPAGGAPWTFPLVGLPSDEADLARRALRGPGGRIAPPTPALLSPDGRSVVTGWLRFVSLLDASTGAVRARRRLPGVIRSLDHQPAGGYRITVDDGRGEQTDVLLGPSLDGPITAPQQLERTAWRDQLRREACALAPEFDDEIEVRSLSASPDDPSRWLSFPRLAHERAAVGLRQARLGPVWVGSGPEAKIAGVEHGVLPDSARGLELHELRLVDPSRFPRVPKGTPSYVGNPVAYLRLGSRYRIARFAASAQPAEWLAVAQRLKGTSKRNPWSAAFALVARRSADKQEGKKEPAKRAPFLHVDPSLLDARGHVELACFLDHHGFDALADRQLDVALRSLWAEGPYLPDWAGHGEVDLGRLLADRVDRLVHLERDPQRADVLRAWRDAFAPALHESDFARQALDAKGVSANSPETRAGRTAPPTAPSVASLPRGLAGLDALALARADHAMRLQPRFVLLLLALGLVLLLRYRRHAIRDLDRLGVVGVAERTKLWLKRPILRLYHTLPTYLTLNDKLALVALYLAFFSVFAVQEASVRVVIAARSAPQGLLAGQVNAPAASEFLERRQEFSPEATYVLAWATHARGEPLGAALDSALLSLSLTDPRCHLLWAEAQPQARRAQQLERVRVPERHADHLALAKARAAGDSAAAETLESTLAETDSAWASYRWALARHAAAPIEGIAGPRPLPASPPPARAERDRLLFQAERWSHRLPRLLLLNLLGMQPGDLWQGFLTEFQAANDTNVTLARFHNRWFFLVPMGLLLMIALLFVKTPHRFEPLASDLEPSFGVKAWRRLIPGVAQFQTGRPLRGTFLVVSFLYLGQELVGALTGARVFGGAHSFATHSTSLELATLTGDVASALPFVRSYHTVEMAFALALVYVLHWIDLSVAQRKLYQADEASRLGEAKRREPEFIIPLDSELDVSDERPRDEGSAPGPFDATERDLAAPRPSADRSSDSGPFDATERSLHAPPSSNLAPIDRTELDLLRPRPSGSGAQADTLADASDQGETLAEGSDRGEAESGDPSSA